MLIPHYRQQTKTWSVFLYHSTLSLAPKSAMFFLWLTLWGGGNLSSRQLNHYCPGLQFAFLTPYCFLEYVGPWLPENYLSPDYNINTMSKRSLASHCPGDWSGRINRLRLCRGIRLHLHPSEFSGYDTRQYDGEVPVMLELSEMQSSP